MFSYSKNLNKLKKVFLYLLYIKQINLLVMITQSQFQIKIVNKNNNERNNKLNIFNGLKKYYFVTYNIL